MNEIEFELTETKWALLKELEQGPLSPKELADLTNTSIANASQQLKLLEAQGYLKKIKKKGVNSRQDRDARVLYGLSKSKIWITKIGQDKVARKEFRNADNFFINLLFCDIKELIHVVKFFIEREDIFKKMQCLYYLQTINQEIHFLIITDELDFFRKDNHSFEVKYQNKSVIIKFWSHSSSEFKHSLEKEESYFVDLFKRVSFIWCVNESHRISELKK